MTYKIRVTLSGIKGFYRVYTIGASQSLYTLHKQMRADMEFAQDQLILFKALDADGGVVARYGLFDLGDGTVDAVSIDAAVKKGIASFVYFYDVAGRKSVNVTFEGTVDTPAPQLPTLMDVKGPNPIEFENGYVAFEDLPEEKRRLPDDDEEDGKKHRKGSLADILGIDLDDDDEEDEDDEEEEEDEDKEEEDLIYDENEDGV